MNALRWWTFVYKACLDRSFTFKNCVSGPVQSVIWLCVRDVCLGASVQRVLQREQRQQGWSGVFAPPQRDHIRLWWGMRKKILLCTLIASITRFKHFVCVSPLMQLLSKPKFSAVEKIKTIGSTYMAAAGLTHSPLGDERKVFFVSHKSKCIHPFLKGIYKMF